MKTLFLKQWKQMLGAFFGAVLMGSSAMAATTADIVFVVDESGSMAGEHTWLGNMVTALDSALATAGVTNNRYGMIGYGGYDATSQVSHSHAVDLPTGIWGSASELSTATGTLIASGSLEDGYQAIRYGFDNYTTRAGAAVNYILVTDEDRDTNYSTANGNVSGRFLNYNNILSLFSGSNALLNAVVNASFQDGANNKGALGIDSTPDSYFADGLGGFTTSPGGSVWRDYGTTKENYVDLALATGGAAWDLNQLRAGGNTAVSFTNAFVDVKVGEIIVQPPGQVPVPAALWLFGSALLGLVGFKRKQAQA